MVNSLFQAVPFASMNMNTLSLIHELSKKCRDITHKVLTFFLLVNILQTAMQELLWTIVSDVSTPAPSEMRVASLNYLQETVKQFEFRPFRCHPANYFSYAARMDWMFKIMDSIRCGMACLYCYDLFTTILRTKILFHPVQRFSNIPCDSVSYRHSACYYRAITTAINWRISPS